MAMAPTDIPNTALPTPSPQTSRAHTPSLRNPLPLSSSQEAQVKDLYYKRVRSKCADEIREFALCAKGRTVTASFYCRKERLAMNSCMIAHATRENEDLAREEWFSSIQERRLKKEEDFQATESRRMEVIEMTRRQEEKERRLKDEEERRKREAVETQGKATKKGWWG